MARMQPLTYMAVGTGDSDFESKDIARRLKWLENANELAFR
jgi:hypothetical protein